MKRFFTWMSLIGGSIVAIAYALSFLLPPDYRVERSIVIDAPPERIHVWVSDLSRWPLWVAWHDEDPEIRITLGGTARGVGATQSWSGERGSGRMTVTESTPERGIRYDRFADGGRSKSVGAIVYTTHRDGTLVTWSLAGEVGDSVLGRYEAFFLDRSVGPRFDRGLQRLRAAVEGE
jgi:uncharacterized membrane protein